MARPERFELPTLCFEGRCSIQLSYGRVFETHSVYGACPLVRNSGALRLTYGERKHRYTSELITNEFTNVSLIREKIRTEDPGVLFRRAPDVDEYNGAAFRAPPATRSVRPQRSSLTDDSTPPASSEVSVRSHSSNAHLRVFSCARDEAEQ